MEEFITSIKAHLYERTTSPLSGVFIVSWMLWNYKLIFLLFSSMEIDDKFNYIETFLYPNQETCLYYGLFYPLLTVVFFIFIYPYPAQFVYSFWRKRQKDLKEVRQKIEDETPLTVEESRLIRKEIINLNLEY